MRDHSSLKRIAFTAETPCLQRKFAESKLLTFFGFAFLAWFATPTNRNANLASHRFRFSRVAIVIAIVAICSIAACCGLSPSTKQPQNYTVTFTAGTGSTKQTIIFMLTVNCTAEKLSLVKFTG